MSQATPVKSSLKKEKIRPIPFGERNGAEPYNASELIALADSRFLFCDNNISEALFEFRLAPDGSVAGPLIRHPINGIKAGAVDDLEGMELVERAGRRFIFATSSLCLKKRKKHRQAKNKRGKVSAARSAILRITLSDDDQLQAEIIPDFRTWLIEQMPELGKAAQRLPDDDGLNIEALGWDPRTRALLFGVRSPVLAGQPCLLRARLKKFNGPWLLSNFETLPPITLNIKTKGKAAKGEQGIRAISYDTERGGSLIVVGNSTSASKAPFKLYLWDGNLQGSVIPFEEIRFHRKMKVEGVAHGQINGRGALVFVDDGGGYQVLWDDDPRLAAIG